MSIKKLVIWGAALLLAMLCLGGIVAASRINVIRIGGPVQTEIQQVSDLVADILPPPEYVIEPFFEATALLRDPSQYSVHAARLTKLQQDYDNRHAYWVASSLEPTLRKSIVEDTHHSATRFWAELNDRFLPAVKANDAAKMNASYARLSDDYNDQRAMVDKTVIMAAEYQAKLKANADGQLAWAIGLLLVIGAATLGMVGVACLGLLRRVIDPLVEVVDATTALAAGGSATVPHLTRTDELGKMAQAVESFRQATVARAEADACLSNEQQLVTTTLGDGLVALQQGNLTKFIRTEFPGGYGNLKISFNEAMGALREMIQLVSESARELTIGADDIASATDNLARRTQSDAASLEETNAALGQISGRLKATSTSSALTVQRAGQAIGTVARGRGTAVHAVTAMDRVSGSAKGIDSVIEGLDKIAFQTRVLAMNAAVEAGRAGDAGRGFAVVADLVSALAMRAEEEAKRARDELTVTLDEIAVAVGAVKKVDGVLEEIAADVEEVNTLLATMASDNTAQSLAIGEITSAMSVMDQSTQRNAAMVEQTSAATRTLSHAVRTLADRAAVFTFERRVRNIPVAVDRRAGGKSRVARDAAPAREEWMART